MWLYHTGLYIVLCNDVILCEIYTNKHSNTNFSKIIQIDKNQIVNII